MATTRLLVLGAVRRRGRAHGYQVRSDLESWGAHEWADATSGAVYHALKTMTREGLLEQSDPIRSTSGGPPRVDYELTGRGQDRYFELLRGALTERDARLDTLAAGVGFIDDLPRSEAIRLLQQRAAAMHEWRDSVTSSIPPATDLSTWGPVGEVLRLWLDTAESRARWTHELIERLEGGTFKMADDP